MFGRKGLAPDQQPSGSDGRAKAKKPVRASGFEPRIENSAEVIEDALDFVTDAMDFDVVSIATSFVWDQLMEKSDVRSQGSEDKR